eukprot:COSAG01_NODE_23504_length_812_cov_8.938289_2_plen_78_part_00
MEQLVGDAENRLAGRLDQQLGQGGEQLAAQCEAQVRTESAPHTSRFTPALFPDVNRDKAASDRYPRYRFDGQLTEQR